LLRLITKHQRCAYWVPAITRKHRQCLKITCSLFYFKIIHIEQIWDELIREVCHKWLYRASCQWDVVYNPPSISVVDAKGIDILLKFSYLYFDTLIFLFLIFHPCSLKLRYAKTHLYGNVQRLAIWYNIYIDLQKCASLLVPLNIQSTLPIQSPVLRGHLFLVLL